MHSNPKYSLIASVLRWKQEESALVQIQEIAGLLGGMITLTMVALVSVRQWLQQAAMELGEDLAADTVLALELDGSASTRLGHVLRLAANSFNSLLEKHRKGCIKVVG